MFYTRVMKNQHSWSEVDSQLQEEGLLLLAGAVAAYQCQSPTWGIIFALAYFFVVAHLHDLKAKNWSRNEFIAKLNGGSFFGKEYTEYRILRDQLKQDHPKRDLFIAKFSYWLIITVIVYQVALFNSFSITGAQVLDWFRDCRSEIISIF